MAGVLNWLLKMGSEINYILGERERERERGGLSFFVGATAVHLSREWFRMCCGLHQHITHKGGIIPGSWWCKGVALHCLLRCYPITDVTPCVIWGSIHASFMNINAG